VSIVPQTLEFEGRCFVPAGTLQVEDWPIVERDRPQPTLTLKDNDLFLITDTLGNISGSMTDEVVASMGLFCADTRFLSRLDFQIDGNAPVLLSSTAERGFILTVLCTNQHIENRIPADTIGIRREMVLNGGLFEEIELSNHSIHPVRFQVSLSFQADFVDLFEVRGTVRDQRGQLLILHPEHFSKDHPPHGMILAYQGLDGVLMESRIEFWPTRLPDTLHGHTALWDLELLPQQRQTIGYRLQLFQNNQFASVEGSLGTLLQAKSAELVEQQEWQAHSTHLTTDNLAINQMIRQAEQDVHLLLQSFAHGKTLSAGVPWFSTLFGRDSIIAAMQMLILNPAIARDTLLLLAHYQGTTVDSWRDEEVGKILHELRLGEMARCGEIPHTPYFGTIDATPLWLILYCDYYTWTNDRATIETLWPQALAAMDWIDRGSQPTGYLSYARQSDKGLRNQGWKDSGNCIVDSKGFMAEGSIALSEVQGYVYSAKLRLGEIAILLGHSELAHRWSAEAKALKERFNQDFWMGEQDFCALALDGNGQPVDGITSNPGHCLSLGILDHDKALSVAERLRAPDMFSGWGIRTLSSLSPAYNPMGYHIGSVWPHDNAMIAVGLRSLGLIDQALEVSQGLFDMTLAQPYARPPELFCGYERIGESTPVRYPVACSPQAWATGSIFQLLQMMAHLVPDAPANGLRIIHPTLPQSFNRLVLTNLRVGSTVIDLEFERVNTATACRVLNKRGNLKVMIEA
jgi:glycogen debranching enzyme